MHFRHSSIMLGFAAVIGIALALVVLDPGPAPLSAAHVQLEELSRLSGCVSCHSDEGLSAGCRSCHTEIDEQLRDTSGYHGHLYETEEHECSDCHGEHHGVEFEVAGDLAWRDLDRDGFDHPHVEFQLTDRHDDLECTECHDPELIEPVSLPSSPDLVRVTTFLGVDQACTSCHEDIHAGGSVTKCSECHDQKAFSPAPHFDHDQHMILGERHSETECSGCHPIPENATTLPFNEVTGATCKDCHETPHSEVIVGGCDDCHEVDLRHWIDAREHMAGPSHDMTGFVLSLPHATIECRACHDDTQPYEERFHVGSQSREEHQCRVCHEDPHEGQFEREYGECTDCHRDDRFSPSNFTVALHETFALNGAHLAVPCESCHEPAESITDRIFEGTERTCKGCHDDPHAGQFDDQLTNADCDACHSDPDTFRVPEFDHEKETGYALVGGHADASCQDCHTKQAFPGGLEALRFSGTPTGCSDCHGDPHGGQFEIDSNTDCLRCHSGPESWAADRFDHDRDSRFELDGSHEKVPCADCHPQVTVGSTNYVHYKPLGTECQDCHEVTDF